jgi:hypothetical protein
MTCDVLCCAPAKTTGSYPSTKALVDAVAANVPWRLRQIKAVKALPGAQLSDVQLLLVGGGSLSATQICRDHFFDVADYGVRRARTRARRQGGGPRLRGGGLCWPLRSRCVSLLRAAALPTLTSFNAVLRSTCAASWRT